MTCPICLDEINQDDIIETPCGHSFHKHCYKQFMQIKPECPVCRTVISDNKLEFFQETNNEYYDSEKTIPFLNEEINLKHLEKSPPSCWTRTKNETFLEPIYSALTVTGKEIFVTSYLRSLLLFGNVEKHFLELRIDENGKKFYCTKQVLKNFMNREVYNIFCGWLYSCLMHLAGKHQFQTYPLLHRITNDIVIKHIMARNVSYDELQCIVAAAIYNCIDIFCRYNNNFFLSNEARDSFNQDDIKSDLFILSENTINTEDLEHYINVQRVLSQN